MMHWLTGCPWEEQMQMHPEQLASLRYAAEKMMQLKMKMAGMGPPK